MELSDQESPLALVAPIIYIIRACLHIHGMFTSGRDAVWSQVCWSRAGLQRKHPFSPPLHSLYVIGQVPASHWWQAHRVPPSVVAWPSSSRSRGPSSQGWNQGETEQWEKPFHSQPLTLTFFWSHHIRLELAPSRETPPPRDIQGFETFWINRKIKFSLIILKIALERK